MSTSNSSFTNGRLITRDYVYQGTPTFRIWFASFADNLDITAVTDMYCLIRSDAPFTGADIRGQGASFGISCIDIELATV
jgi:hypothetical protein